MMSSQIQQNGSIWIATIAGAITGWYNAMNDRDFIKTVVLAVVGAVVSFTVSTLLKMVAKKWKK